MSFELLIIFILIIIGCFLFFKNNILFKNMSPSNIRRTSEVWLNKRMVVEIKGISILGRINLIYYSPYYNTFTIISTDNNITSLSILNASTSELTKKVTVPNFISGNNRSTVDSSFLYVEQNDTFTNMYKLKDLTYAGNRKWKFSGGDTLINSAGDIVVGYYKSEVWEATLQNYINKYITTYSPSGNSDFPTVSPIKIGIGACIYETSLCLHSKDHRIFDTYRISTYRFPKIRSQWYTFPKLRSKWIRFKLW